MKICDLCQMKATSLRAGPPEFPSMETCEDCAQDFLRRLSILEARIVEIRQRLRRGGRGMEEGAGDENENGA